MRAGKVVSSGGYGATLATSLLLLVFSPRSVHAAERFLPPSEYPALVSDGRVDPNLRRMPSPRDADALTALLRRICEALRPGSSPHPGWPEGSTVDWRIEGRFDALVSCEEPAWNEHPATPFDAFAFEFDVPRADVPEDGAFHLFGDNEFFDPRPLLFLPPDPNVYFRASLVAKPRGISLFPVTPHRAPAIPPDLAPAIAAGLRDLRFSPRPTVVEDCRPRTARGREAAVLEAYRAALAWAEAQQKREPRQRYRHVLSSAVPSDTFQMIGRNELEELRCPLSDDLSCGAFFDFEREHRENLFVEPSTLRQLGLPTVDPPPPRVPRPPRPRKFDPTKITIIRGAVPAEAPPEDVRFGVSRVGLNADFSQAVLVVEAPGVYGCGSALLVLRRDAAAYRVAAAIPSACLMY